MPSPGIFRASGLGYSLPCDRAKVPSLAHAHLLSHRAWTNGAAERTRCSVISEDQGFQPSRTSSTTRWSTFGGNPDATAFNRGEPSDSPRQGGLSMGVASSIGRWLGLPYLKFPFRSVFESEGSYQASGFAGSPFGSGASKRRKDQ